MGINLGEIRWSGSNWLRSASDCTLVSKESEGVCVDVKDFYE